MINKSEQWQRVLRENKNYGTTKEEVYRHYAIYEYNIYKNIGGKRIDEVLENAIEYYTKR